MFNWVPAARWAHGLVASFIGGGAGAVTAGITASMLAPGQFNLHETDAVWNMFKLMYWTFGLNGMLSAFLYLKQSPLPPWEDGDEERRH